MDCGSENVIGIEIQPERSCSSTARRRSASSGDVLEEFWGAGSSGGGGAGSADRSTASTSCDISSGVMTAFEISRLMSAVRYMRSSSFSFERFDLGGEVAFHVSA
ncbi:MAG: hypothetical protein JWP03_261 [Phycisphaerales bacterium]|nr:hypothetical protein [Phycisphaerales bacterium]